MITNNNQYKITKQWLSIWNKVVQDKNDSNDRIEKAQKAAAISVRDELKEQVEAYENKCGKTKR